MKIETIYDDGFFKPLEPPDVPSDSIVTIQSLQVVPYDLASVIRARRKIASFPPQNLTPISEEGHDRIIDVEHHERGLQRQ